MPTRWLPPLPCAAPQQHRRTVASHPPSSTPLPDDLKAPSPPLLPTPATSPPPRPSWRARCSAWWGTSSSPSTAAAAAAPSLWPWTGRPATRWGYLTRRPQTTGGASWAPRTAGARGSGRGGVRSGREEWRRFRAAPGWPGSHGSMSWVWCTGSRHQCAGWSRSSRGQERAFVHRARALGVHCA